MFELYVTQANSAFITSPILSYSTLFILAILDATSSSVIQSQNAIAYLFLLTKVFSCLNNTVSPPRVYSFSPAPTFKVFIGGAVASDNFCIASSDMCGHLLTSTAPPATFIEKAIQVGNPHSLQFFFGVNLKI